MSFAQEFGEFGARSQRIEPGVSYHCLMAEKSIVNGARQHFQRRTFRPQVTELPCQIIHSLRDPEGMYYLARQLSYLRAEGPALEVLSRAINNGFFCHQAMVRDPWLDALRARAEFTELLRKAHQLQREASTAFLAGGGPALLGIRSEGY